ncbi:hypothetical protein BDZ91DRAFT_711870 [Kalaharituber pfeilii]|nr:hypothetical protein BDZ91DRAFT_711870 [Kalaharituber pfeilii]
MAHYQRKHYAKSPSTVIVYQYCWVFINSCYMTSALYCAFPHQTSNSIHMIVHYAI